MERKGAWLECGTWLDNRKLSLVGSPPIKTVAGAEPWWEPRPPPHAPTPIGEGDDDALVALLLDVLPVLGAEAPAVVEVVLVEVVPVPGAGELAALVGRGPGPKGG